MSFSTEERDQELYRHIVEAYGFIERYLDGITSADFSMDRKTQDAVCMRLQQILECSSKLSTTSKEKLKIKWPLLVAMRNKISHSYVDVDADVVWAVVAELEEFRHLIEWAKKNI